MKKHHKASGGQTAGEKDFGKPRDDAKEDENTKPARYNNAPKIEGAAEEKKKGGRAKRKRGGKANMHISKHHEEGEHMKHAHHIGKVHGEQKFHAGKAGRATGGRAGKAGGGSNFSPLSSAHGGTPPRDHKVEEMD